MHFAFVIAHAVHVRTDTRRTTRDDPHVRHLIVAAAERLCRRRDTLALQVQSETVCLCDLPC